MLANPVPLARAKLTDVTVFPVPTSADATDPEPLTDKVSPLTMLLKVEKSDPFIVVVPS